MIRKLSDRVGLLAVVCMVSAASQGATLKVPQQYPTIQQAVNAATNGDTVRVAAGVYAERVFIVGKAVSLVGAGAGQSIIDAGGSAGGNGRPITVSATGPLKVTIAGFTLRNGYTTWDDLSFIGAGQGGGLYAENANIVIRDDVLTGNLGCLGTALATLEATVSLVHNRIENNPGTHDCGQQAIMLRANLGGESFVTGNVIRDHNVTGLQLQGLGTTTVNNNVFSNNRASVEFGLEYGGLISLYTPVTLTNNLFTGNSGIASGGALIGLSGEGVAHISGNSFVGNFGTLTSSSLNLSGYTPGEFVLKSNQFDESTDQPVITCSSEYVIDRSNVFGSNSEGVLTGACVTGNE